jgi:hypothetical protein
MSEDPLSEQPRQEIDGVDLTGKRDDANPQVRLGRPDDHWHLHAVCIRLPTDYEPYGYRIRTGPDCSCGCTWFMPLQVHPMDWGVCSNPQSPRCGLLTFEHQGCAFFTGELPPAAESGAD